MLSRARALWQRHYEKAKQSGAELPVSLSAAREHLLVVEGSDWCWWYGEEHFTPHGPEFDRLFRNRIKAAYRELGETAPDSLDIPIVRPDKIPSVKNLLASPRGYIRPLINGKLTSYFEWSAATRYLPAPDFGTMHRSETSAMTCLLYGFDESTLYLRIDLHHRIFEPPGNPVEVEFLFPGKNRKVYLLLDPAEKAVRCAVGTIGEALAGKAAATMPDAVKAAFHNVMELGIPFQGLGCEGENQIGFFLTIRPQGSVGERYPTYGQFTADLPGSDFEERMWEV